MERFTPTETLACRNLELNTAVEEVEHAAVNCEIAGFATSIAAQENQLAFIRYQQARIALASKIFTLKLHEYHAQQNSSPRDRRRNHAPRATL